MEKNSGTGKPALEWAFTLDPRELVRRARQLEPAGKPALESAFALDPRELVKRARQLERSLLRRR